MPTNRRKRAPQRKDQINERYLGYLYHGHDFSFLDSRDPVPAFLIEEARALWNEIRPTFTAETLAADILSSDSFEAGGLMKDTFGWWVFELGREAKWFHEHRSKTESPEQYAYYKELGALDWKGPEPDYV